MEPPALTTGRPPAVAGAAAPPQPQWRRRRGSRVVEWTLLFAIAYAILTLLKLEPLARNSVQNHNSKSDVIDLPRVKRLRSNEVEVGRQPPFKLRPPREQDNVILNSPWIVYGDHNNHNIISKANQPPLIFSNTSSSYQRLSTKCFFLPMVILMKASVKY